MNMDLVEQEFKKIMSSEDSCHFNIISRGFSVNNREDFICQNFKNYRKFSERKGAELLFGTKQYKGIDHIFIKIDKEKFITDNNISYVELYKNGIIFTEGEFFVF